MKIAFFHELPQKTGSRKSVDAIAEHLGRTNTVDLYYVDKSSSYHKKSERSLIYICNCIWVIIPLRNKYANMKEVYSKMKMYIKFSLAKNNFFCIMESPYHINMIHYILFGFYLIIVFGVFGFLAVFMMHIRDYLQYSRYITQITRVYFVIMILISIFGGYYVLTGTIFPQTKQPIQRVNL